MLNYCADTTNFLTKVFCLILQPILDGFDNVTPYAMHTLKLLAALEVVLAAIWWGFGKEDVIEAFLKQIMKIGFFILIVANFQALSGIVLESLIKVGIITGSVTGTATNAEVQEFARPGSLVDRGVSLAGSMMNEIQAIINWNVGADLSWPLGSLEPIVEGVQRMVNFFVYIHFIIMILVCALLAIIFFFLMALQVFLAFMEFFISAVLSVILIPFGVFKHTEFVSKQVFPMVFNHGVKLMIMAFIITIFDRLLPGGSSLQAFITALGPASIVLTTPPGKAYACVFTVMILFLMLKLLNEAPRLASGMMSGTPQYSANVGAMALGAAQSVGQKILAAKTGGASSAAGAGGAGGAAGASGGAGLGSAVKMGSGTQGGGSQAAMGASSSSKGSSMSNSSSMMGKSGGMGSSMSSMGSSSSSQGKSTGGGQTTVTLPSSSQSDTSSSTQASYSANEANTAASKASYHASQTASFGESFLSKAAQQQS